MRAKLNKFDRMIEEQHAEDPDMGEWTGASPGTIAALGEPSIRFHLSDLSRILRARDPYSSDIRLIRLTNISDRLPTSRCFVPRLSDLTASPSRPFASLSHVPAPFPFAVR